MVKSYCAVGCTNRHSNGTSLSFTARQLSRVRIHVKRVIGVLTQKYSILESTLSINMIMCDEATNVSVIDKIVVVCSSLCNFCDSVVPIFN